MKPWQLGNTSVRSALRIKDGLTALSASDLQGKIRGQDGDKEFRRLLGEYGIVSLGEDKSNSVGRKWRSAMGKLGFLYPDVSKSEQSKLGESIGIPDTITPAGWNLILAKTVGAIQECYLRAMIVPLVFIEGSGKTFSPLCWTLAILLELEKRGEDAFLSFMEFCLVVQTSTPGDGLRKVVDSVLQLRYEREKSEHKRNFDRKITEQIGREVGVKAESLHDYGDMNIRYLKATGMVRAKGRGISLAPEKHSLALKLVLDFESERPYIELCKIQCAGAPLPTDNADFALECVKNLLRLLPQYKLSYSIDIETLTDVVKINAVRYELEELIAQKREESFALQQADKWQEIAAYMEMIIQKRSYMKDKDMDLRIPSSETPAYFEWVLWRAFLAIDNLVNRSYEVRRFKVDRDFFPISVAPGNGPDLIAEFADNILVVEATLSENSRQEAMEGEPVRRHVADLIQGHGKPVLGLFVANRIDTNTAETFRRGVWYSRDDEKIDLCIVPLTLEQFMKFFKTLFRNGRATPRALIDLIHECSERRDDVEAPQWKQEISEIVKNHISTEV